MSISNLIIFLIIFLSFWLSIKQPIKVDNRNIFTLKSGVQDLIVPHYDCSPQHITIIQYYKLNKIGKRKIKPADFQIIPAQISIFSQIRTIQVPAYAINAKLSDKRIFCHKISFRRGFWFDHDNWYVKLNFA